MKWLENALQEEFLSLRSVQGFLSNPLIASEWIKNNYENLPADARPETLSPESLQPFSNLIGSYLQTTHKLIENPGTRYVPVELSGHGDRHTRNRYLTPVWLSRKDKQRAAELRTEFLTNFLWERDVLIDDFVSWYGFENELSRIAYLTYVDCLIKRLDGHHVGAAHLALWREMAWHREGSPKQRFAFNLEGYHKSVKQLEKIVMSFS
ncbi:MAG: hypothetical protein AAF804_09920 [Bacteroidota bacterium]